MHMLAGCLIKGKSLSGYLARGQLEIHTFQARHEQLALEMKRRGYNHKSPLPMVKTYQSGKIDIGANLEDLKCRCQKCRQRIESSKMEEYQCHQK